MTLSTTRRAELVRLASEPVAVPAIHHLADLYRRYGAHGAREVTEAIAEATLNTGWVERHFAVQFSGFIGGSDTRGFREELQDPFASNPQTGHFFSFVVWALDGVSGFEYAMAIGHELRSDLLPLHEFWQVDRGLTPDAANLRQVVELQDHAASATLNYHALDVALAIHGWTASTIHSHTYSLEIPYTGVGLEAHTGNSIQDLRCTVAGLVLGRVIAAGSFADAAGVVPWLERNVLASR